MYNLEKYNDEHFASWCKNDVYNSDMAQRYELIYFHHLVPGFDTMDMSLYRLKQKTEFYIDSADEEELRVENQGN